MLRATLKSLLSRKLRLVLSALSIVLAVMFVAAALVLQDTLNRSFDAAYRSAFDGVQLQVIGSSPLGGDASATPPVPLDETVVTAVSKVPGVAAARGEVRADGARIIGRDGKVPDADGQRVGVSWSDASGATLKEGRAPAAADEIVINAGLAEKTGYRVGDTAGVLTTRPNQTFTIVGIATYAGRDDLVNGEQTISFAPRTAGELMLGKAGSYSSVDISVAAGTDTGTLKADVQGVLGRELVVRTGDEAADDAAGPARSTSSSITRILLGFSGVAVLVGAFLIANAFSIVVTQRTKELALLRALGANRGQVRRSVLLEALIVSVLSSIVGFALGLLIGRAAASALGGSTGVPIAGFRLPVAALLVSFLVGIGVTLISALVPARRASRVAPVAAMRQALPTERPGKVRTIVGAVLFGLGVAALVAGAAGGAVGAIGVGGVATFVGIVLLTPALVRPATGLIRGLTRSTPARLGRLNAARNPQRAALTVVSLMIGVMLVTLVSTILTSYRSTVTQTVQDNLNAELIIYSSSAGPGTTPPSIDPSALQKMRQEPGVAAAAGFSYETARVDGKDQLVYAWDDVDQMSRIASVRALSGTIGTDRVMVNESTAKSMGLAVGDRTNVQLVRGPEVQLEVGAIFADTRVVDGFVVPWSQAGTGFRSPQPSQAYVQLADGATQADVRNRISTLLAGSPEVDVHDRSELIDDNAQALNMIISIVQVLLAIAMIIAILGVVNTLVLSILERVGELGMLRAVGMYRREVRRMIVTESVVMSVLGAVLGVVLGAGVGLAAVRAFNDQGITDVAIPWPLMLVYVVASAIVGVLAALAPAGRAAKLDVLTAVRAV
ncbi:ABC transporter permease [Actinoplanes sp. LDG1-06]|uniref:ABC transporter permease n=1 Tax=Paractinoplanes ovalisporus TaxID=2810368 RepID=A0ABS2AI83_9ACTN|nr:ABC transporter permease [Actinoplanes ovalisporus]MBM2619503.1 ABC transporter permease [Actinoplanes ovalisporus]